MPILFESKYVGGIPVIVSEDIPKDVIVFGPALPQSVADLVSDGCTTTEEWIKKHIKEFSVIRNTRSRDDQPKPQ